VELRQECLNQKIISAQKLLCEELKYFFKTKKKKIDFLGKLMIPAKSSTYEKYTQPDCAGEDVWRLLISLYLLHHDVGHLLPDCVWEDVWRQLMITPGIPCFSLLP
jgi:hypothetical protein